MDVRGAVQRARAFVEDLLQDEGITDVGLEEVVFDDESNEWKITIGFSRPWDLAGDRRELFDFETGPSRSYKVIRIADDNGEVKAFTDRILPAAPN